MSQHIPYFAQALPESNVGFQRDRKSNLKLNEDPDTAGAKMVFVTYLEKFSGKDHDTLNKFEARAKEKVKILNN